MYRDITLEQRKEFFTDYKNNMNRAIQDLRLLRARYKEDRYNLLNDEGDLKDPEHEKDLYYLDGQIKDLTDVMYRARISISLLSRKWNLTYMYTLNLE